MRRVSEALDQLSKRVGFRIMPGLGERVIYRELFPKGLTMIDAKEFGEMGLAHVAARQELREMMSALALPERRDAAVRLMAKLLLVAAGSDLGRCGRIVKPKPQAPCRRRRGGSARGPRGSARTPTRTKSAPRTAGLSGASIPTRAARPNWPGGSMRRAMCCCGEHADRLVTEIPEMTHRFDPTSLREYDIRGVVGKTLGPGRCRRDRARVRDAGAARGRHAGRGRL